MTSTVTESDLETAALDWLHDLGYQILGGPDIAPGEPAAERATYSDVLLSGEIQVSDVPSSTLEAADAIP